MISDAKTPVETKPVVLPAERPPQVRPFEFNYLEEVKISRAVVDSLFKEQRQERLKILS